MIRPPPRSTLFPYPTLFRSLRSRRFDIFEPFPQPIRLQRVGELADLGIGGLGEFDVGVLRNLRHRTVEVVEVELRSEEHTSELQSQSNLVCRLLLAKKKKQYPEGILLRRKKPAPSVGFGSASYGHHRPTDSMPSAPTRGFQTYP